MEAEINSIRTINGELTMNETPERLPNKVDELVNALLKASGRRLLICIKGYPDPDNIASALALAYIAQNFNIETTIVHFEQISHHEIKALVKKLDVEIEEYSEKFDYTGFDYYSLNDTQSIDLPIRLPDHCQLLTFIDRHKRVGVIRAEFIDIREGAGSTSAIFGEYLQDSRLGFTGDNAEQSKIATALMHGIRSATDNFVNASPLDFTASEFITKLIDKDLFNLISRQSIPAKTMDLTQIALQRKDVRGTFMFSGVGYVRFEDRDGIGQCADYLLHREGIDTVVVYGVVGGECIEGALRTKSHTLDPDKWIKDVFGHDPQGAFYGGGKKDKGTFNIPLGLFAQCTDRELLWILIKKTIDELFYQKIGIENTETMITD
jgi:nanoRNase/pAp phosphatase (c-di-AMP/oligoRNAs hydrolase)